MSCYSCVHKFLWNFFHLITLRISIYYLVRWRHIYRYYEFFHVDVQVHHKRFARFQLKNSQTRLLACNNVSYRLFFPYDYIYLHICMYINMYICTYFLWNFLLLFLHMLMFNELLIKCCYSFCCAPKTISGTCATHMQCHFSLSHNYTCVCWVLLLLVTQYANFVQKKKTNKK